MNDPSFQDRLDEVVARAVDREVRWFIVPAYDVDSLARTRRIVSDHPGVLFPAYGIHPWYIDESTDADSLLNPYVRDRGVVAIGEIGLDLAPGCPQPEQQIPILKQQLTLAVDLDLPVIIHCRKAHDQLYPLLKDYKGAIRGVMHSYSGSRELMFKFLDLGFYIAFAGSVTRRTAKKYHKNAKEVPLDRLLLETDAPSIATETTVASLVEPGHITEVAQQIADLRDMPYDELCGQSTENAANLFRLPSPIVAR